MKLIRVMKLSKNEILEILKNGITFNKATCWSGENISKNEWHDVSHIEGIEVVFTLESNSNNFRRPNLELEQDAFDWNEMDEYRNINPMNFIIEDSKFTLECIEENGFNEVFDTNFIDFTLIQI